MDRAADLDRFYAVLGELAERTGGPRTLAECDGRMGWPRRGVYFFFEPGEHRSDGALRVVRVGTHALGASSRTTLWGRLSQHRGPVAGRRAGGGNHRGSVFRKHVGGALIRRDGCGGEAASTWGAGSNAAAPVREREHELECLVSRTIRSMPFLWLAVDDPPGADSARAVIEAGSIALLSGAEQPSTGWLGHHAGARGVRASGLWNVRHVDEPYDRAFLDVFERLTA